MLFASFRGNLVRLGNVESGDMTRAALIVVLAAAFLAGACTSTSSPSSGPSPTEADETRSLDPCSLLSQGLVGTTLPGAVTQVRELTADDFPIPPPLGRVLCAYQTNGRYGQLILSTEPMGRNEYEVLYVRRDPHQHAQGS